VRAGWLQGRGSRIDNLYNRGFAQIREYAKLRTLVWNAQVRFGAERGQNNFETPVSLCELFGIEFCALFGIGSELGTGQ